MKYFKNSQGMTLIEAMIAVIITLIGILSLMSLFPQGYYLSAQSDKMSRAAALLREELEIQEAWMMNECNVISTGNFEKTVYSSGGSYTSGVGDVAYRVLTNIAVLPDGNGWRVRVEVHDAAEANLNKYIIRESLIITRQEYHQHGC